MTSLNVFVVPQQNPEVIHIATDGQTYIGNEPMPQEVQKVAILANLPAVIGTRGGHMILPTLTATISQNCATFDDLITILPDLFKATCQKYWDVAEKYGDSSPRRAHLIVAGYSQQRDRLEAYNLVSLDYQNFTAWRPTDIESSIVCPWSKELIEKLGPLNEDDLLKNPEGIVVRLMDLQRSNLFENFDTGEFTVSGNLAAGKFVQLTTLTRDGISTRIVKRWT